MNDGSVVVTQPPLSLCDGWTLRPCHRLVLLRRHAGWHVSVPDGGGPPRYVEVIVVGGHVKACVCRGGSVSVPNKTTGASPDPRNHFFTGPHLSFTIATVPKKVSLQYSFDAFRPSLDSFFFLKKSNALSLQLHRAALPFLTVSVLPVTESCP